MTSLTTQSQWPAIAATGVTGAPVQSEPGVASKAWEQGWAEGGRPRAGADEEANG